MSLTSIIRKLSPFVKPYKWMVITSLVLTLVGAALAQVNAIMLDHAIDSISHLQSLQGNIWPAAWRMLALIASILLAKELLSVVCRYYQTYLGERMLSSLTRDLSQTAIERCLTYKISYFDNQENSSGRILSRIGQGVSALSSMVQNTFIEILPLFLSSLFALLLMFIANIYIGLLALSIIPLYIWITIRQANLLKGCREELRLCREEESHSVVSLVEGILVIKSFLQEQHEASKLRTTHDAIAEKQLYTRRTMLYYEAWKQTIQKIGSILIILLTAYLVLDGHHDITIGKIVYHAMLFANATAPVTQLQRIFDTLHDARTYAQGYFDIVDADAVESTGTYRPHHVDGHILMKGINFTYPNGKKAIHDVHIEIKPNSVTALVGLSGAGKTTLLHLLEKYYYPQDGQILLDGHPLNEYNTIYLRSQIGLLLQNNYIFDGTIRDNILFGKPTATDDEILSAAQKATLWADIQRMPQGLNTNAKTLSGGQQQRVAIARIFLKNPPILLLDEPTASLDAVATEQIHKSLQAIQQGRTVILVTHSISTTVEADYIYVLKDGHVEHHGQPHTLYHESPTYQSIMDAATRTMNIPRIMQTLKQ